MSNGTIRLALPLIGVVVCVAAVQWMPPRLQPGAPQASSNNLELGGSLSLTGASIELVGGTTIAAGRISVTGSTNEVSLSTLSAPRLSVSQDNSIMSTGYAEQSPFWSIVTDNGTSICSMSVGGLRGCSSSPIGSP
jgi:hypothetical protein